MMNATGAQLKFLKRWEEVKNERDMGRIMYNESRDMNGNGSQLFKNLILYASAKENPLKLLG